MTQPPIKRKPEAQSIAMVLFSKSHVTAINSQDPLSKDHHPLRELTIAKYAERKDPLWWNVLGKTELRPRVVRSWAINRTRVAFKDALKRKGYDENGYRLSDSADGQRPEKDLVGSVLFMVNQGAAKASFEELNTEADAVLDAILQSSRTKGQGGPSRPAPRRDSYQKKPTTGGSFSIRRQ